MNGETEFQPTMLPEATWVRPPSRGSLHRKRRAIQAVTSLIFILAPFVDLLRFDLKNSALIMAGVSFSLSEMLAVFLVILVFIIAVFAGALLYGRVFCGWMCPQTTLSEIVSGIERRACKLSKKVGLGGLCRLAAPLAALGISAFVAASLVTYFLDPADRLSPPRLAWISWAITTFVLFADLYFLRHGFCLSVCPYGIMQKIIQDSRTLGVAFDSERRSECTNCMLCVRACFMGIDIRESSFDTSCLNCGDCISATTLAKRCPTQPLIRFRYGTEPSSWPGFLGKLGILDGRRAVVVGITLAVTLLTVGLLASRRDLDMEIAAQYERTFTDPSGVVHNHYRLSLGNRLDRPVRLHLEVRGAPEVSIESPPKPEIDLAPGEHGIRDVVMSAPASSLGAGAHTIVVRGVAEGATFVSELSTHFFVPSRR
jgi:polyferredoxin